MSKRTKDVQLPISRIKMIMKSSPECESIGSDALFMVTKCTEMFIQYMSLEGLERGRGQMLDYKGIANFVQSRTSLNFLAEILPQKLSVKECLKLISEGSDRSFNENDDESSEEAESA